MSRLLALALLLLPLAASAANPELERAKNTFDFGRYDEARAIAEKLLADNVLADDQDLIEANRIVGLAYFYGNLPDRLERSRKYLLDLLVIEPDYKLDPFFTPPLAVQFFESIRQENQAQLAPIREQRRRAREAQRLAEEARKAEEEARRRFLEEQNRTRGETREIRTRQLALVFLPLGAGQFQNDETTKGVALASVQVVAGLTSVGSLIGIEVLRSGETGNFTRTDKRSADRLNTARYVSGAIFYAAWAYGIVDAWLNFEPQTVRVLPQPSGPRLTPSVSPLPGGGALELHLSF